MRQVNVNVLPATANTATVIGNTIDSNQLIDMSFHLVVSDSTAAGALVIQASNDVAQVGQTAQNFVPTNWAQVSSTTQAAGTQQVIVQLSNVSYRWVRAVWTHTTSGSGTVQVNMMAFGE